MDPKLQKKLKAFRGICEGKKLCQYWTSPADLGTKVTVSLVQLIKAHPAVGWVRGDQVPAEATANTLVRLETENEALRAKLTALTKEGPPGAERFAQGEDFHVVNYRLEQEGGHTANGGISISWNEIFSVLAPHLVTAEDEQELQKAFENFVVHKNPRTVRASLNREEFRQVLIQLRALGYISKSPSGLPGHWTLTRMALPEVLTSYSETA